MVEYVALTETVYKFKFYHKGQTLNAGEELDSNPNFERVGGSKPAVAKNDGKQDGNTVDEVAIRTRAKELKIANWHNKNIKNLLAEIAEVEAKLAAPTIVTEDESPDDDKPADGKVQAEN